MLSVVQRVSFACVRVDGEVVGEIGAGLVALLGVQAGDTVEDAQWLAEKVAALRIFEDADGKMNRSLRDLDAGPAAIEKIRPTLLVVSQFTLLGSTRKGTRPSFNDAARPDVAIPLYEAFVQFAGAALERPVATGKFGAMMKVELVNDGPVTLILNSREK